MIEKKIFVNTSAKYFCEWLRKVRGVNDLKTYPTENGYFSLGRAEYRETFYDTLKIMTIAGSYIYPKDAEQQKSNGYQDIVEVYVQELDSERIEITIRTYFSGIEDFIEDLLCEIQQLWPNSIVGKDDNSINGNLSEILSEQREMQEKLNIIYQALITNSFEQKEIIIIMAELEKAISGLLNSDEIILKPDDKVRLLSEQKLINSDANIKSKLKLTIPIIPLLLNYDIELERSIGVDMVGLINKISSTLNNKSESMRNHDGSDADLLSKVKILGEGDERHKQGGIKSDDNQKLSRRQVVVGIIGIIAAIIICFVTPLWDFLVKDWLSERVTPYSIYSDTPELMISSTYPYGSTFTKTKLSPFETETRTIVTPFVTEYSTSTNTKTITPSLTVAQPSLNSSISIGIIKLKDSCWNEETNERKDEEIIQKLTGFGFTNIVPIEISSDYYTLEEFDIIYLPSGWYCQSDEIKSRVNQFQEYTKHGGGLLLGNPDIPDYEDELNFEIFQTIFTYEPNPNITSAFPPEIISHDPPRSIIEDIKNTYFPLPENSIKPNIYSNIYAISKGSNNTGLSLLIVDPYENGRAIFLTGGEFSESPHPMSEKMWVRIIYWLAKKID